MVLESMLSVSYIIATFISTIVAFIVIVISDKILAHNIDAKHSFIIAIIALFIGPIVGMLIATYVNIAIPYFNLILSVVLWIILGEILLKEGSFVKKLEVMVIAFVVYMILDWYVLPSLMGFIPF
jgi:hypothetical protein